MYRQSVITPWVSGNSLSKFSEFSGSSDQGPVEDARFSYATGIAQEDMAPHL